MEGILESAMRFAFEKHEGQKRKGTIVPYIVHPVDVMNILLEMDADTNLLVAGLLHDVVEDAGVSVSEIEQRFGQEVAQMVAGHSEDKSLTWRERKLRSIRETEQGDDRLKMLVLADKLSDLKSLYYDYKKCGETVWNRFNAPKEMQAWYYSRMIDALTPLCDSEKTAPLFWELNSIFMDLFVTFFYEDQERILYQNCISGEKSCLSSNIPEWRMYTDDLPADAVKIERKLYISDVSVGKALALEFGSGAFGERVETFCRQAGIGFERTVL